jgi:hypothetical protein
MRIRSFDQGFHPSSFDLSIVMEQNQQFATRERSTAIASSGQAEIDRRTDHLDAGRRRS